MNKQTQTEVAKKSTELDDALYRQDRQRAETLYAELKDGLTVGARKEVESQIAAMPIPTGGAVETPRQTMVRNWVEYAKKHLEGRKIVEVCYLNETETEALGWFGSALLMRLDDGTLLYPSADDEGNDAGALFGQTKSGEELTFPVV